MAYTVKQLAKLSGVSVRTLHFYDEIGLLKPAYFGANGYRFYEEEQLFILQQILFFRELGFELKKIQKVLGGKDFDKIAALSSHKQVLQENMVRIEELIKTIDKTVEHLKGKKKMKEQEIYRGFSKERAEYLANRFGEKGARLVAESKEKMKDWTPKDYERSRKEFNEVCKDLASLMAEHLPVESAEVQKVIRRHHDWLRRHWTPSREDYIGLGQYYIEFEWKEAFEPYDSQHPKLARYLSEGMKVFALKELN